MSNTDTNSNTDSATVSDAAPLTASWTQYLPEAFGIRENIQQSPFRWCVRESFMWGIATGTTMGFHRLRMKSHPFFATNVAFATSLLVTLPSYYFCFKRREHKEATIELMMKANDFQHEEEMPEPVPVQQHPFLKTNEKNGGDEEEKRLQKEFVARLKEKKEWQKQLPAAQDASDVFQEVPKKK